ncbi:unnamed protein product [Rhizoctonia solani]|uniref:Uncharacterized protein n=1 Tax=Rhizoctonia solani TaxID=456999 RepID=A0A8H3HMZ3_9AGAM|nr:unnamed protein product [Rhizoctonia solani]
MGREASGGQKLNKKTSKWSLFRVKNESASTVKKENAGGSSTATVKSLLGSLDAQPSVPFPSSEPKYVHPHAPGATHIPPPTAPHPPAPVPVPVPAQIPFPVHAPHTPSPLGGRRPADRWGDSPIGQFGTSPVGAARVYKAPRGNGSNSSLSGPTTPASSVSAFGAPALAHAHAPPIPTSATPVARVYERASAAESNNWRQSTSTVSTSFTHFSNGSARTVSTVATSVSSGSGYHKGSPAPSVRSGPKRQQQQQQQSNVKYIEGTPWELDALPRQAHPRVNGQLVQGHIHGGPTSSRRNKPRNANIGLGTISEQPAGDRKSVQLERQRSASPEVPKKVQKGQINTLRGMLRAFGGNKD